MIISDILSNNYIFYDKKRIDKIINIMFLDKNDEYSSFLFDKNEIHVINKIIEFLSCYNGNNLFEDLKSFILNHGKYNVEFYIYFIFYFPVCISATDAKLRLAYILSAPSRVLQRKRSS